MIQLRALSSGSSPGQIWELDAFPCVLGRGASASIRIEQPGIWDRHLQFDLQPDQGFKLTVLPGALAAVNGIPVESALLRSGDLIEVGAVKIQFAFQPTRQRGFRLREVVTWVALILLCALQVLMIYGLLR